MPNNPTPTQGDALDLDWLDSLLRQAKWCHDIVHNPPCNSEFCFAEASITRARERVPALIRELEQLRQRNGDPSTKDAKERDACQLCKGFRGGVPGNENIIDGVIACDYCSGTIYSYKRLLDAAAKAEREGL